MKRERGRAGMKREAGHGMDDSRCGPLSSRRPVMHDPFGSCSFPAQAKRVNLF